jgi:hypothetical protein
MVIEAERCTDLGVYTKYNYMCKRRKFCEVHIWTRGSGVEG